MLFMGKKRNLPKKEDFLKKALLEAQQSFENAYKGLENVNDPDLIDSYIYEINAANLRYKVLLRDVKMLSENNNN
ncbi:MAG: YaaL family protein [Lachnospiraceae bacterium]|nr:YaaL family protein [Lachnospiraceae bacterium]MCI5588650.1 YaaL family protein [Lachnospiraceae bacterium]